MYYFAQTNIQLFNQLTDAGYSESDILTISNTYKLAIELFSGYYRSSGKTFIAHLVGTASILTFVNSNTEVIAAGLIHAAYEQGDFGDGTRGISKFKQKQVQKVVGATVEKYVAKYAALKWNQQTIPNIYNNLDKLDAVNKKVLLMRLANELEDNLDCGQLYHQDAHIHLSTINTYGDLIIEMAHKLGYSTLAAELLKAFHTNLSASTVKLLEDSNYFYNLPFHLSTKRFIGGFTYRFRVLVKQIYLSIMSYNEKEKA